MSLSVVFACDNLQAVSRHQPRPTHPPKISDLILLGYGSKSLKMRTIMGNDFRLRMIFIHKEN